jgi:hypothetical protein
VRRLSVVGGGLLSGVMLGMGGAFVQADRVRVSGVLIPYGLVLALACALLWQLWFGRDTQDRLATVSVAVAWVVTTVKLGMGSSGGDVALPANGRVTAYLLAGAVVVTVGAILPPMRPHVDSPADDTH